MLLRVLLMGELPSEMVLDASASAAAERNALQFQLVLRLRPGAQHSRQAVNAALRGAALKAEKRPIVLPGLLQQQRPPPPASGSTQLHRLYAHRFDWPGRAGQEHQEAIVQQAAPDVAEAVASARRSVLVISGSRERPTSVPVVCMGNWAVTIASLVDGALANELTTMSGRDLLWAILAAGGLAELQGQGIAWADLSPLLSDGSELSDPRRIEERLLGRRRVAQLSAQAARELVDGLPGVRSVICLKREPFTTLADSGLFGEELRCVPRLTLCDTRRHAEAYLGHCRALLEALCTALGRRSNQAQPATSCWSWPATTLPRPS
jgi:hypothetical protein